MLQLEMFTDAPPRHPNSLKAYERLPLSVIQSEVLEAAGKLGEFTHAELCAAVSWRGESSVRGRCSELVGQGLIEDTGKAGNDTTVWRVSQ